MIIYYYTEQTSADCGNMIKTLGKCNSAELSTTHLPLSELCKIFAVFVVCGNFLELITQYKTLSERN